VDRRRQRRPGPVDDGIRALESRLSTVRQTFIPLLLDAASRISEQLGAALSLDGRRRTPESRTV